MTHAIRVGLDNSSELNREELIAEVDKELEAFNLWFIQSFDGAEPLARFEQAILKTYLMWKMESGENQQVGEQTEATAQQAE